MDRGNHYEAAFEEYLRQRRLPYIGVDESKRAVLAGGGPLKSLDFIVYGVKGCRLLVDVKGRKYEGVKKKTWESWSTRDDVEGLTKWQEIFGPAFDAVFVFMYELGPAVRMAPDTADLWSWRGQRYLVRAVLVDEYTKQMRVRSPKWKTVGLPAAAFKSIVKPLIEITHLRGFMERGQAN